MIKRAKIEDLRAVQDLCHLLYEKEEHDYDMLLNTNWPISDKGKDFFQKELSDGNKAIFIAEQKTKAVGYILGYCKPQPIYKNNVVEAVIDQMFVIDEYRGQGIGSKLIEGFITWAKESGAKRIEVRASYQNDQGVKFYKKNGFDNFDVVLKKDL